MALTMIRFSTPELKLGPYNMPVGDKLQYHLRQEGIPADKKLTYEFCSFKNEHAYVPILLHFEAPSKDYELFIMAGLAFTEASDRWDFVVTKQRVRQGKVGYELQEVYGLNASAVSKSFNKDAAADDGREGLCVVCLTGTTDTFLMPCRHMCLCGACAAQMASMHQGCPMCRKAISHIVHMSQMGAK
ncbi:RING zinc finger containing protein [Babesia ovata]|uniref:RING zinc finger containing protein n=1 Tax=Babesia ovata TaxID=189622 RepID=A0A2H6KAX1_9APIC|nr:RING zinc finger containing protein [Babesia ovata]GBE60109.1 RING zinc finger containing protein [Babesia ovata]